MALITLKERGYVRELVEEYEKHRPTLTVFLNALREQFLADPQLSEHIHSVKARTKDPVHLRGKLFRKLEAQAKLGKPFRITPKNILMKVNDLAGIRILHLHTQQILPIKNGLRNLFENENIRVIEGPKARTWDDESRQFYKKHKIRTVSSPSLYTSVHYVIVPNKKQRFTCEVQVRTLMEEVWGEVDHTLNYPVPSKVLCCREQIAALARSTSACSRLVDSIFQSDRGHSR